MKSVLYSYFIKNKKNFIIITTIFCIGIMVGILFINNSNETQKNEINTYIQDLTNNIKNLNNINRFEMLCISLKENILFIIVIWFLGCTIIGGVFIYVAILYKGFSLGYTISALIAVLGVRHGALVAITSLLLQNIIFLPAMFIVSENRYKIMW